MEIDDFFEVYPKQTDSHIQEIIAKKREFIQYRGQKNESINPLKHFFNHQRLVGQLMFLADRCLLIHKTGTGKTCTLETISETLIAFMARWGFNFSRTYVIIDKSLQDNLIRELACVCNREKYLTEEIKEPHEFSTKMRRLRKRIKKFFSFRSRLKFAEEIDKLDNESLKVYFKNSLIFVDEAHLLLNLQTHQEEHETRKNKLNSIREQRRQFERLFQNVSEMKIVLSTATPAINTPIDALILANLILPLDNRIDLDKIQSEYENISNSKTEDMEFKLNETELNKLKGYISFVEAFRTSIISNYVGVPYEQIYTLFHRDESQFPYSYTNKVFPIPLTKLQIEAIKAIGGRHYGYGNNISLDPSESFAELFTFPDLGSNQEAFNKYLSDHRNHDMLRGDNLKKYSYRYYHFLRSNLEQPNKKSFTYIPYIVGSGINTLREVLLANGYEEYSGTAFLETEDTNTGTSVCNTDVENKISTKFKPRLRFAIMTGENPSVHGMIISLYNHYQNWDGAYLQILIGSDVTKFSYSFLDVSNIYIMLPQWNRANMYQALSRGIRTNSHQLTLQNLGLEQYEVNIYQYCSY